MDAMERELHKREIDRMKAQYYYWTPIIRVAFIIVVLCTSVLFLEPKNTFLRFTTPKKSDTSIQERVSALEESEFSRALVNVRLEILAEAMAREQSIFAIAPDLTRELYLREFFYRLLAISLGNTEVINQVVAEGVPVDAGRLAL